MAGLAVVAVVLAGCSEPEQPSTTLPTATSTSAAAPTLEPLGPADFPVPDEAREATLDGALAMTAYYFDLLNYSQSVPTGEWLRAVSRDCAVCTSSADYFDASAADGVTFQGGSFSLLSSSGQLTSDDEASTAVRLQLDAVQATGSDGQIRPDESFASSTLSGGAFLAWDQEESVWLITQVDLGEV